MMRGAKQHDVFLSFGGEDTRNGFTTHLYAALCRKKIRTFMHHALVRGGDAVSQSQIIQGSNIYVIIFSQHYACSPWCLDELTQILECKQRYGRDVIPVFYKVDPLDVRDQRGSYGDAFVKHQQRFRDRVQGWKTALTLAAGLSGWGSKLISPEYLLVEDIVQDIWRRLNLITYSIDYQGLVGMYNHIAKIKSLMHDELAPVQIIGICGVGGVGKTTIAGAIYHNLASQFSFSTFVVNVQEQIERYGIHHIQSKYLSELLEQKMPVDNLGLMGLKERLKEAKVLLILDNVNNSVQIKDLIGGHRSFGIGSRIIMTSRDMQVLKNAEVDEIYEVKEMDFQDSLHLFSSNAFKRNYPIENFVSLSEKALNYAKGIPLALKVLGSMLYGRTEEEWKNLLQKLEKLPGIESSDVLKLSYDGLSNEQKDMFLDIACLYKGHYMNTVKQAFDSCGFSATIGMRALIDRGLISVLKGEVVMNDLIQEMGQEIVRRQCASEPGKCSRLWKHEDIYDVLRENKGTDAIHCVFLDMCQIKQVQLSSETFKMMHNLRLLQFYKSDSTQDSKVHIPAFLESLPGNLRLLYWDGFPQRLMPQEFFPKNLVELDMRDSHLEQLWERDQHLPNLKRLDLSGSKNLIQVPDLSQSPNIEEIILSHCISLVRVYSSSFLNELNCLWLDGCDGLRSLNLPSNILSKSSGLIVLYDCFNLEFFSVSNITKEVPLYGHSRSRSIESMFRNCLPGGMIQCQMGTRTRSIFEKFSDTFDPNPIDHVDLDEETMDNIHLLNLKALREGSPSLFPSLAELCWLDLSYCESLTSLPRDLCKLKYLRRLHLSGCSNLQKLPEIEETMENLMVLILDQTAIQELPLSLHHLVGLEELSLRRCRRLKFIPSSIGCLCKLSLLDLTYCESLEKLPSSIFKLKLTKLDLHGCSMLRAFPDILEPAETYVHIRLTKTGIKEIQSSLEYLTWLQSLQLNSCKDLEFLPSSIGNVKLLSKLDFSGCEKLSELPSDIGQLSSLRELSLHESGIVTLPDSIAHLSSLKSMDLSDCKSLECIPGLPLSLEHLFAFDCPSIERVSSSRVNKLTSDSKEGCFFKFHLTNSQELNPSSQSNIAADAWLRILHDGYRSVLFCFPGSAVPHWFPNRSKGHSVTLFNKGSINWSKDNRFISFALCAVLGLEGMDDEECKYSVFSYRFTIECDDGTIHTFPSHDQIRYYFHWKGRQRFIVNDHTLIWKYNLDTSSSSIRHVLSQVHNFTFEICEYDVGRFWPNIPRPKFKVKECGISPTHYTNAKDDDDNNARGCL